MTQIARHIATVQGPAHRAGIPRRLRLRRRSALRLSSRLASLVTRISPLAIPHPILAIIILLAAGVTDAIIFAVRRRPTSRQAAAMIDQSLDLQERFSTAIYVQDRNDTFSQAVWPMLKNWPARSTLRGKFPLRASPWIWLAVATVIFTLLLWWLFPTRAASANGLLAQQQLQQAASKQVLAEAVKKIEAHAKTFGNDTQIQKARAELQKEFNSPPKDPEQARRDAANFNKSPRPPINRASNPRPPRRARRKCFRN